MNAVIANYTQQRTAFAALCEQSCTHRILLLRGVSGSGKTTLLRHCRTQIPGHIRHAPIDLRNTNAISVSEIFQRIGRVLRWEHLPAFTEQVAAMQESPVVKIDRNWLTGINNHINVVLQTESPVDRDHRRALLTDAWFDDAQALAQPFLLIFDHYEDAGSDVKAWISGQLLPRIIYGTQVRTVVAGQEIPNPHTIEWDECCTPFDLYGVPEARDWLPVVADMGLRLEGLDPVSVLVTLCLTCEGNPSKIVKALETFQRLEAGR